MKNLKIYRKALALVAASSLLLMSGCSASTEESKSSESCTHLTVYFEDQPITFKECEGYSIDAWDSTKGGELHYDIKKDGKKIFSDAITNEYNMYEVNHGSADEIIEEESVQKFK